MTVIILYFSGIVCIMSALAEIHKKQFAEEGKTGGFLGLFFDVFFYKYLFTHLKYLKGAIFQFILGAILMLVALYLNEEAQVLAQ